MGTESQIQKGKAMRLIDADRIVYSWTTDADGEEHDGVTLQSIINKMPTIEPTQDSRSNTLDALDCISRQAAIDAVCKASCGAGCGMPCDEIFALEELPSAQPDLQPTCNQLATDCISRQAAIDMFQRLADDAWNQRVTTTWANAYSEAVDFIEELPSAHPDIIACGDCKHWINHDRRCGFWNHGVRIIDWCSRAERREDG